MGFPQPNRTRRPRGFSLMECLMLVIIVGIVGATAGRMLQSQARAPRDTELQFQLETALVSKMEALRGMTYAQLPLGNPASTLCDNVTINGESYLRAVAIVATDVTGDGVADANIKKVTVTVGGLAVSTLVNQP